MNKLMVALFFLCIPVIFANPINKNTNRSSLAGEKSIVTDSSTNQVFTPIDASIENVMAGDGAWCDYDTDGDPDIIVCGSSSSFPKKVFSIIYRNDTGSFVDIHAGLVPLSESSVSWGDYNNDNMPDLAISGVDYNFKTRIIIYKNLGGDKFSSIYSISSDGYNFTSVSWGDSDNDGDLDLMVSYSSGTRAELYRNDGNENFSMRFIPITTYGETEWTDFDNDGDLDISVGWGIHYNNGNNNFKYAASLQPKNGHFEGPFTWGDFDSDGDQDFLDLKGIYKNNGGTFVNVLAGLYALSSVCGDMDNDGDLDILHMGDEYSKGVHYLRNNGDFNFDDTILDIQGTVFGSLSLGDYDSDGDLDILITGEAGDSAFTRIYRNDGIAPNTPPSAPSGLSAITGDDVVILKWAKGSDKKTTSDGLSYNLRITTDSDASSGKSSMSDSISGRRYIAAIGNINQVTEWPFHPGRSGRYFYSVQTIDNGFVGSEFSEEKEFIIVSTSPEPFNLHSPADNDTLDNYRIIFSWTESPAIFNGPLTYSLKIFSSENDTVISLRDTSYIFYGSGWIVPDVEYKWFVLANDESHTIASIDTFKFTYRKLDAGIITDSMSIYITDQKDSAAFVDKNGRMVMQIFWEAGAVQGANDTLKIGIREKPLVPEPAKFNYALSNPLIIEPKNLDSISVSRGKIRIRLYTDTTLFHLPDVGSNTCVYRVDELLSTINLLFEYNNDHKEDWLEFFLSKISRNTSVMVIAQNILIGEFFKNSFEPLNYGYMLVPTGKTAVLNEGVKLSGVIIVNGKLECYGTLSNPVNLERNYIYASGTSDSNFANNEEKINFKNVIAEALSVTSCNAVLKDCNVKGINLKGHSELRAEQINTYNMDIRYSKVMIDSSLFDSSGHCFLGFSIGEIRNSTFSLSDLSLNKSLLRFSHNSIKSIASSALEAFNSFVWIENNKFTYNGDTTVFMENTGIELAENNYAIVRNNILANFGIGTNLLSGNKAIIYNNTFINNTGGVVLTSSPDTVSIHNNIFYKQGLAMVISPFEEANGQNVAYINDNLWTEKDYRGIKRYIYNDGGKAVKIGDTISYHTDPLFRDTLDYFLSENSPAIDAGMVSIPAFEYTYSGLDTTIQVGRIIEINEYNGAAPDLGAYEYDGTVIVESIEVPKVYQLYQNFPNPFNPQTRINYSLPKQSHVVLKMFDILGAEILTLVDEEKPAGNYSIDFNAANLASGIYFYQLKANEFSFTKKMILLR